MFIDNGWHRRIDYFLSSSSATIISCIEKAVMFRFKSARAWLLLMLVQPARAFNTSPVTLQEELGCSPTLSLLFQRENFYFDPLGLASDENFARYREAELKHGRVAMVGFVYSWVSLVTISDGGLLEIVRKGQLPPIYQLLKDWPLTDIYKFIAICGVLETFVLVQVNPTDMPGDYGVGYLGIRDKGRNERSLVSELENGRLAMLVMLYYVIRDIQVNTESYQGVVKGILKAF